MGYQTISGAVGNFSQFLFQNQQPSIRHRYRSFDLCYSYFYNNQQQLAGNNLEQSCMVLWSFLGSWGMLRSGGIKWANPFILSEVIKYVANPNNSYLWGIDINNYSSRIFPEGRTGAEALAKEFTDIEDILNKELEKCVLNGFQPKTATITLVTKIMLGIHANVPAFDTYVTKTLRKLGLLKLRKNKFVNAKDAFLGVESLYNGFDGKMPQNPISLDTNVIYTPTSGSSINQEFSNISTIDVLDFNGRPTNLKYSKAKIVDMFAFEYGRLI